MKNDENLKSKYILNASDKKPDSVPHIQNGQDETSLFNHHSLKEDHLLAQALKELNLYDELYEFMKSKCITAEALKFMKWRHIDELFNGTKLHLKIIFEARLSEWQLRKRRSTYDHGISLEIENKSWHGETFQLFSIKHNASNDTESTTFHVPEKMDFLNFSNRLMDVIQKGLCTVLKEYGLEGTHQNLGLNENELSDPSKVPTISDSANKTSIDNAEKLNITSTETASPTVIHSARIEDQFRNEGEENINTSVTGSPSKINDTNLVQMPEQCPKKSKPSSQIIGNEVLEPAVAHYNKRKWGIEMEVRKILLMYKPGNFILKYYQSFGMLTSALRSDLVHVIVDHFVLNNEFVCVTQCRSLAQQIVELFPTENLETYFSQENKSVTPKGKLWNHYQNERRMQKRNSFKQYTKSNRLKMESTCAGLKNIDDVSFLLKKWNKTFHYRRYQLSSEYFSNWKAYFDEYPFCKQQNYAIFIDADLATLYPDLTFNDQLWEDFLNNFQIHFWNRINEETPKKLFNEICALNELNTTTDYFAIRILQLLHAVLINNNTYVEDPLRQFTVEVNNFSDLKSIVLNRKKYCLHHELQCKPYIAVVRQNDIYVHYSVVLDATGFGCDNYKEALILCFKLFLFFDISFPEDSFGVWLFIQQYFFNKPSHIVDATVNAFIDEVRARSNVELELKT
ncbi:uncharacterized protein LOC106086195 isoform X2 [Stomoxys calcitrans]|nr:uncharacterized protein LOC106086195 isoform X2 [Stomoxys calcitrans]